MLASAGGRSTLRCGAGPTQQPARQRPGVLTVAERHLAPGDRGHIADALLDEPRRASGQVVHQARRALGDVVEVDHVQVGAHPLGHHATIE